MLQQVAPGRATALLYRAHSARACGRATGFSIIELLVVLVIAAVMTAMAMPVMSSVQAGMKVNAAVSAINGAIQKTRYRAIRNSQIYTLALTAPQNTYIVTNVATGIADRALNLPSQVRINNGAGQTYTFTFCPNGIVYGAGGACPNVTLPTPLTLTYRTRQTNMSFSQVGNVTATVIH
jgi:prepilin-type N-terminal cleavage/methylation domain-containing protein